MARRFHGIRLTSVSSFVEGDLRVSVCDFELIFNYIKLKLVLLISKSNEIRLVKRKLNDKQ